MSESQVCEETVLVLAVQCRVLEKKTKSDEREELEFLSLMCVRTITTSPQNVTRRQSVPRLTDCNTCIVLLLGMDVLAIVDHDIRGNWTDGKRMSRAAGPVGLFLILYTTILVII